eukprot:2117116-Alexandrium_andersonii.AAC.1
MGEERLRKRPPASTVSCERAREAPPRYEHVDLGAGEEAERQVGPIQRPPREAGRATGRRPP